MATNPEQLQNQGDALRDKGLGDDAALRYADAARQFEQAGDLLSAASSWHMAGVSMKHDQAKAMELFKAAITFYEEAGDEVGVGRVYRDQAVTYAYRAEHEEALKLLEESREVLAKTKAKDELGITIAKIGNVLTHQGEYDEAAAKLYEGLALIKQQPNAFYEGTAYMHLAQLRLRQKEFKSALVYSHTAAKTLARQNPEMDFNQAMDYFGRRSAQIYGIMAQSYLGLGNTKLAGDYFVKSLDYIKPLAADAAEVLLQDIGAGDFVESIKSSDPNLNRKLAKHPVFKRLR